MEKKVYCALGQQCKCIKFVSEEGLSDVDIIRRKIKDICMRDKSLNITMHNKTIVIQMKDSDKDVWCDVEENEDIPDKVYLNVIFVSMSESLSFSPEENNSLVMSKISIDQEILPTDVKVLYTEPIVIEQHGDTDTTVMF